MYPSIRRVNGLCGEATIAQVEYAQQISKTLDIELPREKTKQAYSDFISQNARKYKKRKA
jgi:hypothetical protein